MITDSTLRISLIATVALFLVACGSSAKKRADAGDAGRPADVADGAVADVAVDRPVFWDAPLSQADTPIDAQADAPSAAQLDAPNDAQADTAAQRETSTDTEFDTPRQGPDQAGGVDGGYDGSPIDRAGSPGADAGAALLSIDPKGGDFGLISPPSPPMVFTVSNIGSGPSGAVTATISGNATAVSYYKITANSCGQGLSPGESCQVTVVFVANPGAGGPYVVSLTFEAEGIPGAKWIVKLSGETP